MTPPVIAEYFRIVNTAQWDAIGELWTDDAELRAVGARPCRGPEEIAAYYPRTLGALPVHHDEPTRVVVAGDTVLVEIHFVGRTTDDRPVEFDAVDVFDLRDGRIARLSIWYDTAGVRAQIRP